MSYQLLITEAAFAPSSARTVDEANYALASVYAPEYCWATQMFKQPSPAEAAKSLHNELVYGGWRSRAGIA